MATAHAAHTERSYAGQTMKMRQSIDDFELAFEREAAVERQRRQQLRQRAAARSRAREIQTVQQRGNVAFGALFVALAVTVIAVVVVMFETLAWLIG